MNKKIMNNPNKNEGFYFNSVKLEDESYKIIMILSGSYKRSWFQKLV